MLVFDGCLNPTLPSALDPFQVIFSHQLTLSLIGLVCTTPPSFLGGLQESMNDLGTLNPTSIVACR